ncbi:MAG: hypothetical protein R3A80_08040 [Bdellovibrionota bacterium]
MKYESTPLGSSLKALPVLIYIKAWKACGTGPFQQNVFFQGVLQGPQGKYLQLRVPNSTWRQEMTLQRIKILTAFCDACIDLGLSKNYLPTECVIVV